LTDLATKSIKPAKFKKYSKILPIKRNYYFTISDFRFKNKFDLPDHKEMDFIREHIFDIFYNEAKEYPGFPQRKYNIYC
jgi:hypothetical protein